MSTHAGSANSPVITIASNSLLKSISMLAAGSFLVFIVGFAPVSAIHNAAHDTRHTSAMPCH